VTGLVRGDHAYRVPGHLGSGPAGSGNSSDDVAQRARRSVHSSAEPEPGDASCVPANSHVSAPGTSETSAPIDRA
jgi:hypothetical protein